MNDAPNLTGHEYLVGFAFLFVLLAALAWLEVAKRPGDQTYLKRAAQLTAMALFSGMGAWIIRS